MQVEASQGGGTGDDDDDTAVNSICLECNNGMEICSSKGYWGTWGSSAESSAGYDAADFQLEEGSDDESGGNNLKLYTSTSSSSFTEHAVSGVTIPGWGNWLGKQYCRKGAKICAIQTQVEAMQSTGTDDAALDGVRLFCCANVDSVKVHLDAIYEIEGNSGDGSTYTETKQVSVGLISSSQIDESTSFSVAASVSASVGWGGVSASVGLEAGYAKSAFSSALNSREQQRTRNTVWQVTFSDPLYVYQGRTTVYMSDGGTFELAGDVIQQSDSKLDVTNIEVLS